MPALKPDSLALSLLAAAHAVAAVEGGTALPQALAQAAARLQLTPQARGAAQDLAYRTLRQLGRAETLLGAMTQKKPEPPLLHGLLCCTLALLSDPGGQAYDAFTLVNQAVDAAASDATVAHAKGMVNAVLRRYLREAEPLLAEALRKPAALWNYPTWWIDTVKAAYPKQWQEILRAGNGAPPMTLRVNRRKTDVGSYLAMLDKEGISAAQIGPSAIRLAQPLPVTRIPGFASGLSSVQDAGAQLAAPLLDVQDGMRVLDACAAPGGKTGHLLELADIDLLAMDSDPQRLPRIAENLERLQLRAHLAAGDAAKRDWWDGKPYDRILADVPCTASGI
ncbi:MAG TPA: 16S rRNA (cytosine(967)-C(5))-methyltransferase RsmB, partial [Burkholderiaceae bacterium]